MFLLNDKKKIAQMVLSESPKLIEKDVPQGVEGDFSVACEQCAKDLIDAVKAGEPRMVSRALRQFMAMAEREEEYSEPSEG